MCNNVENLRVQRGKTTLRAKTKVFFLNPIFKVKKGSVFFNLPTIKHIFWRHSSANSGRKPVSIVTNSQYYGEPSMFFLSHKQHGNVRDFALISE